MEKEKTRRNPVDTEVLCLHVLTHDLPFLNKQRCVSTHNSTLQASPLRGHESSDTSTAIIAPSAQIFGP